MAARELCDTCRGRTWVMVDGRRQDCPSELCEGGYVGTEAQAAARAAAELAAGHDALGRVGLAELIAVAELGRAVDYWSHLAVARGVVARYRRELPEGAATSPPPDWLMWAVLLYGSLSGLVGSIDAFGGEVPPRPPWVLP